MNIAAVLKCLIASTAMLLAMSAQAGVVFNSPTTFGGGNCRFNTTCGPTYFAAQGFSLASAYQMTGASFTVFTNNTTQASAANWILMSDAGGAPGAVLASGAGSTITSRNVIGSSLGYSVVEQGFSLPNVMLDAGSYFFAFQAISSEFQVYLADGSLPSGAYESSNNGSTWSAKYAGRNSVAMSLSGEAVAVPVPEPDSLALIGLSLLALGAARRRQVRKQG